MNVSFWFWIIYYSRNYSGYEKEKNDESKKTPLNLWSAYSVPSALRAINPFNPYNNLRQ